MISWHQDITEVIDLSVLLTFGGCVVCVGNSLPGSNQFLAKSFRDRRSA